jgi:hypothetical protein
MPITTAAAINQKKTERQPPINLVSIGNTKQIKTMMISRCMALCRRASETLRGSFGLVLRLFDEGIGMLEEIVNTIEARQLAPIDFGNFRHQWFGAALHNNPSDGEKTFWRHGA